MPMNHKIFLAQFDAIKKLDKDDHTCFVKAMGGTQHIGPASVADFQQIIDMKRELISAR